MKKILTLTFFIISLNQVCFSQVWNDESAVYSGGGGRVTSAFAIPSSGKGYFICGAPYYHETWVFDTLADSWSTAANFPGGADGTMVAFTINGKGYVGTGVSFGCGIYNEFYEYDPGTNSWTQLANVPGVPRIYAVGFSLNGKGYIGGGITGCNGQGLNDFYSYDPTTNTWDTIAPCPAKGCGLAAAGFSIGDYGYVGTGDSVSPSGTTLTPQQDFWQYDPSTNTWTQMADFPGGARGGCSFFATCSNGFIGLGYSDDNQSVFHDDFYEYDPASNTWTQIANYGGASRSYAPSFAINRSGFVGLGVGTSNATLTDIWEYTLHYTPAFSADTAVCTGGSISFTDTSTYGPVGRVWQFSGGTPATDTAQSVTVQYNTTGYYNVVLTSWDACGDSATKTFTNYVTVTQGPSVSVTPDSPSVCNGQRILLTASGGNNYQWAGTTDNTDTITVQPANDTTYELLVSVGGCTTDTFVAVKENKAPPLLIQPQTPAICPGTTVALSVPLSGKDYVWSPVSSLNSSTGDTVIAKPIKQTTYSVTGIDSLGCEVSDSDVVSVSNAPNIPVITKSGDNLISSATQGNQWVRNDTAITGATNQTYTVTKPGYYQVIASNPANGCSTESDSSFATGINQLIVESGQVTVYPNPTGGEINVTVSSSAMDVNDWNLQVTDMLGRTVYTRLNPLKGTFEIDLSNLSSGVYFICVMNKMGRVVVPVVKQ